MKTTITLENTTIQLDTTSNEIMEYWTGSGKEVIREELHWSDANRLENDLDCFMEFYDNFETFINNERYEYIEFPKFTFICKRQQK